MNNEEVKNAISMLEQALDAGLLDTTETADKLSSLSKLVRNKKIKKYISEKSSDNSEKFNNKVTSSSSSEKNKKISEKSSSSSESSSFHQEETELLSMTYNMVPSEYFIKSDNECDTDSYYNLAMHHSKIVSACSKDSDEIIDL